MLEENYYSNTYLGARSKFIQLMKKSNGKHYEIKLDNQYGSEKEELIIDIGHFGSDDPDAVLIHISGVHGVEGFAGSAIQCQILEEIVKGNLIIPDKAALVFIHGVNPYGMSHYRRFNENNVDLDKNNFDNQNKNDDIDMYREFNNIINPTVEPCCWSLYFFMNQLPIRMIYSLDILKRVMSNGQSLYPLGLFYKGNKMEKSLEKILLHLKIRYGGAKKIFIINTRTGNGYYSKDTVSINSNIENTQNLQVINILGKYHSSKLGSSDRLCSFAKALIDNFENTECTVLTQKFGTYYAGILLNALSCENYYHNHQKININHFSKTDLLNVYYPPNKLWRISVLNRGLELYKQILDHISKN